MAGFTSRRLRRQGASCLRLALAATMLAADGRAVLAGVVRAAPAGPGTAVAGAAGVSALLPVRAPLAPDSLFGPGRSVLPAPASPITPRLAPAAVPAPHAAASAAAAAARAAAQAAPAPEDA
ncbi:MAG: hypothetical protein HY928_12120, partial [Elusimicrobia bacterium]|nr:hypothetical protein [Elusimicrobiota bacterium]